MLRDFLIIFFFEFFLQETFGEFALFFHDYYGGSVIGVVWKPDALEPKDFKVPDLPCRRFDERKKKINIQRGNGHRRFQIHGGRGRQGNRKK